MKNVHPSVREIALLQEATELILSSVDLDTVLHQILLIVRNYFGIANCAVFLLDPAGKELYCRAQNGYDERVMRLRMRIGKDGVTGWAAHTRTPIYVPDVDKEPRYIRVESKIRSELALPLVVRDQVIGVLDIESDKPAYFSESMVALLELFAGQAAVALENARLYSTERRRMRQIELINLIARTATSASQIDQFLGNLADLICDTFEGTEVCILLRDRSGELALRAQAGAREKSAERLAASQRAGIVAQALATGMNVLQDDVATRKDWPACLENGGSELGVPLVSFGETLGVFVVSHPQPNFFSSDDRAIAQAAADVSATAIKNVQLAEELRRVANTDPLTGVYNQRYFHTSITHEISRAKRYNKTFAVTMLDLRDFRQVNNTLGFDAGDDILRQVAQILRSQCRSVDVVCRYAVDRFCLVLPETDRERVQVVLNKIREALKHIQVTINGTSRSLAASFGYVTYPHDGASELALARLLLSRVAAAKKESPAAAQ